MEKRLSDLLASVEFHDPTTALRRLHEIADLGVHDDLLHALAENLAGQLPGCPESDRVLVNLQRFLANSRSPLSWLALFEREPEALETLVRLFAASRYMAEQLISDPESFELVRLTAGHPVASERLEDELSAELSGASDASFIMRSLRNFRHRETLRIAFGDFVGRQSVEVVTREITGLCEAILRAGLQAAQQTLAVRFPVPTHADGQPIGFAVLALGKLGGRELNYSSDVDLVFVRDSVRTRRGLPNAVSDAPIDEYFARLAQLFIKYIGSQTEQGVAYRVDLRLRPGGRDGALVVSFDEAIRYYDMRGRTWERQAFLKARPVAGDLALGESLLEQLRPWIYRRYLTRADISGIAALKRRIERQAAVSQQERLNVKLGRGGIRDIEYAVQFLQLLHGSEAPSVRCENTLDAIHELENAGCITTDECRILQKNYRLLRKLEHLLQIMYDRQTHSLPSDENELRVLVQRVAYVTDSRVRVLDPVSEVMLQALDPTAGESKDFLVRLDKAREQNHKILSHLLHDAFDDEGEVSEEADLILDPEPETELVARVIGAYGFQDPVSAFRNLQSLATETVSFLSTRRCRHFLAAIARRLLAALASTPNPDATLISLARVTESIGGKAVLWELFSSNPATMDLCLRLCATSPYLTDILTSSPGMIDELLDSLVLRALPNREEMAAELDALCAGADDIAPMLLSFKKSMHLRVGARNILRKDSVQQTHQALSDVVEVCIEQVVQHEFHRLVRKLGMPTKDDSEVKAVATQASEVGENPEDVSSPHIGGRSTVGNHQNTDTFIAAEFVVIAVGKLGGREPNYHSDIDLIFLYDGEGETRSLVPDRRFKSTSNRHFFNQLCQRVINAMTRNCIGGKLYDVDVRLRPLGRSGELAITFEDLIRYFSSGDGPIWQRQTLCKARPIWGSPEAQRRAAECIHQILTTANWNAETARDVRRHRLQLEAGAGPSNIKRSAGGTMDIEFIVGALQLEYAKDHPSCLTPNTHEAIAALKAVGAVDDQLASVLADHYGFLRRVESALRLMNTSARHDVPSAPAELRCLAYLLTEPTEEESTGAEHDNLATIGESIRADCSRVQRLNRELFDAHFQPYLAEPAGD